MGSVGGQHGKGEGIGISEPLLQGSRMRMAAACNVRNKRRGRKQIRNRSRTGRRPYLREGGISKHIRQSFQRLGKNGKRLEIRYISPREHIGGNRAARRQEENGRCGGIHFLKCKGAAAMRAPLRNSGGALIFLFRRRA